MCEVAVEMQRMVSCEHKAADTFGMSYYDWAEHRLTQRRRIPTHETAQDWVWRQWEV